MFRLKMLIVALMIVALPLAGCNASSYSGEDETVLKVGSTRPFKTTNKFSDYWYGVLSNITTHDSLIKLDSEMNVTPWLATDWDVSEDGRIFTFTITENAVWHDGTPLTAEDVKFSIKYYRDKDPQAGWMEEIIEEVNIEDDQVVLHLVRAYGNLLTEFMTYSIIPEHIWEDVDEPLKYEKMDRAIGSGPFKLTGWSESAGKIRFEANQGYFKGPPNIDQLEINIYSNMDALVMALKRGDIDTWWDYSGEFPVTHIPALEKESHMDFATATFLGVPAALGFNLEREPVNELGFRRAISYAINYEQIVDRVYEGYGSVPGYGFIPPTHINYDESIPRLDYDAGEASSLLNELGLRDTSGDGIREDDGGNNINLTLLARNDMPSMLRIAEMVIADLKKAGIGASIKAVDSSTWVANKDAGDYDLVLFRATPWGTLMHAGNASGYFDSRRTGAGVLHNLGSPEYHELCDLRLETVMPGEQESLDRAIQQMHAEKLPGIALVWLDSMYPYRKGWDNWVVDHIYGGVINSFSWFEITRVD